MKKKNLLLNLFVVSCLPIAILLSDSYDTPQCILFQKINENIHSGNFNVALVLAKKLLKLSENNCQLTSASNYKIGEIYFLTDKIKKAQLAIKASLELGLQCLSENNIFILSDYQMLARLYKYKKNHIQALVYYKKALRIMKSVEGEDSLEYASFLGEIGEAYDRLENRNLAETYYNKSLEIAFKIHPTPVNLISSLKYNLACIKWISHKTAEAEKLFLESISLLKNNNGYSALELSIRRTSLAALYIGTWHLEKAEKILDDVKKIEEKKMPYELILVNVLEKLGDVYYRQKKYDAAEMSYKRALEIDEEFFPKDDFFKSSIKKNLAILYRTPMDKHPVHQQQLATP